MLGKEKRGLGNHWLLNLLTESNLQLFALISIWVSSKIHDTCSVSVERLKGLGDTSITDQHFTTRDFVEAEMVFLEKIFSFSSGTLPLRKHRAWRAAESRLRRLKDEVMTTQPAKLGAVAAVTDFSLPAPAIRPADAVMPPLELYVERVKAAAVKKHGKKEKLLK